MSVTTALFILTWAAILLLALAIAGLIRQLKLVLVVLERPRSSIGPRVGSRGASELRLGMNGELALPAVLLFADNECTSCDAIVNGLSSHLEILPPEISFRIVFRGAPPAAAVAVNATAVVLKDRQELFEILGVHMTPFVVVVGNDGTVIASEPIGSATRFHEFMAELKEGHIGA